MFNESSWPTAHARFTRAHAGSGTWHSTNNLPDAWQASHGATTFELRLTPSGAIGVYPEQAVNWDWIGRQVRAARRVLKVLNLFAYTGGSTLAAAAAGAEVVHVDAARSVVSWARRNAELSRLADAPIRWIVEDVQRFVQRELRRSEQYDGVILDPPAYGHGPRAQPWKLDRHLASLVQDCGRLTAGRRAFILLTCHDAAWSPANLAGLLADRLSDVHTGDVEAGPLTLRARDGRRLPCGTFARWPA